MAYTTIDDPTIYFNTKLYTGTGSSQSITGIGFQPDWIWFKNRTSGQSHCLVDAVRGRKGLLSDDTSAEMTFDATKDFTSFDSDGFTVGIPHQVNSLNYNTGSIVAWNWLAGGTAPAITYSVKVVSDSGNKYRFDDFGTSAVTLDLQEGGTYTFDQSDSSNSGHPLRFYTASDKSGGEYTTGVTTTGTAGSSGAKTVITVAASAPTLYYQCSNHAGMGGQANTNSTFGSSNFSGSVQTKVSANTTAGFSIVSYTGTGSATTVGHGLGSEPKIVITRNRDTATNWCVYSSQVGNTKSLFLNLNNTSDTATQYWNDTTPSSSVFSVGSNTGTNKSGDDFISYCFAEKKGYSKFGSYLGNGSSDGTYIHLGFRASFFICKRTNSSDDWFIFDNKREGYNVDNDELRANTTATEGTTDRIDILSNGIKHRNSGSAQNGSGSTYIYIAFAESPFVNSNGVPTNAR